MKVLGINDEVTTCEACGKSGLRKTVVLQLDGGGEVHYGTDCAAKAIHGKNTPGNKKAIDDLTRAVTLARKWLDAGHAAGIVATGVGRRFGYACWTTPGVLCIGQDRKTYEPLATIRLV